MVQSKAGRARNREKRHEFIQMQKGHQCSNCGQGTLIAEQLHFHHRDPATKIFQLSQGHKRSWLQINAELAKCDVVCLNCHTLIHNRYEQFSVPKTTTLAKGTTVDEN